MQTADLIKEKAIKLYASLDPSHKTLLEDLFGKNTFQSPIDRIKTFADACEALGENPSDSRFTTLGTADEIAYRRLKVIRNALVGTWVADWDDENQYKWAPWFWLNKPGFRVGGADCGYAVARATGGSRLCFPSRELAVYAGERFLAEYKAWLM